MAFKDYLRSLSIDAPKEGVSSIELLMKTADKIEGGKADGKKPSDFDADQLAMGEKVEREHTDDPAMAREIASDHLAEFPDYYTRLKKMENEAEEHFKKAMEACPGGGARRLGPKPGRGLKLGGGRGLGPGGGKADQSGLATKMEESAPKRKEATKSKTAALIAVGDTVGRTMYTSDVYKTAGVVVETTEDPVEASVKAKHKLPEKEKTALELHPAILGALLGGVGGAGIGALAPRGEEHRLRNALVGAGVGAGVGGVAGALSRAVANRSVIEQAVAAAQDAGFQAGQAKTNAQWADVLKRRGIV